MAKLVYTSRFRKDVKLLLKRNYNIDYLKIAINLLENTEILPAEYRPHKLSGSYSGYWAAHIRPDWLLIWFENPDDGEIWLTRTGTHSDLF